MTKTQLEKVIDYIDRNGSITQKEANYFGCGRLASRICDLKKAGYKIKSKLIKVKNADGSYSHVSKYYWDTEKAEEITNLKEELKVCEARAKWYYHADEDNPCCGFGRISSEYSERVDQIRKRLAELEGNETK